MKRRILLVSAISLVSLFGCSDNNKVPVAETVYKDKGIFDLSDPSETISIEVEIPGSIENIRLSGSRDNEMTYSYTDGILSIYGKDIPNNSGEKELIVTTSEGTTRIPLMVCTNIITTAQEFQDINNDLTGTYILGNDIDLSTIPNFEPLGKFYSEGSPRNDYFHGILDGNGYTVKNATVKYSSTDTTNKEIYEGNPLFKEQCHQAGDNIGIFQIIGSSGVVRNVRFENCNVSARTIGGIIAGNISGTVENCIVVGGSVNISTHFWDDDCNTGAIAGIVAASGVVRNVISTGKASITGTYVDWSDEYIGQVATGGEHANDSDPYWTFWGANKVNETTGEEVLDSNGHSTNGVYSGVGKCWGNVSNCYSLAYTVTPYQEASRAVDFGQTHVGENKPASGQTNMGVISNCLTKTEEELKESSLYTNFDTSIWNIKDGQIPNIKGIYLTK